MSNRLKLVDVTVGYPDRMVLEEVSLSIPTGEVFAIVGPNGVGKSTLIKASSGILPLLEGQIIVEGQDIRSLTPDQRAKLIGVVPL